MRMSYFRLQVTPSIDSAPIKAAGTSRRKRSIGERVCSFLFIQKLMAIDTSASAVRSAFYPRLVCRHCFRKKIGHAHQFTAKTTDVGGETAAESGEDKELRLPVIPGCRAICQGLKNATKYNGACCQVLSYNSSTQRFTVSVQIDGTARRLNIKRSNLTGMSVLELQHDTTLHMRELWNKLQYSGFYESILLRDQQIFSGKDYLTNARNKDWLLNAETNGNFTAFADESRLFINLDPRAYTAWLHQRRNIGLMTFTPNRSIALYDFTIIESHSVRCIQTLLGKFWLKHGKQMKSTWARKDQYWRRCLVLKTLHDLEFQAETARRGQDEL